MSIPGTVVAAEPSDGEAGQVGEPSPDHRWEEDGRAMWHIEVAADIQRADVASQVTRRGVQELCETVERVLVPYLNTPLTQ